MFVKSIHKDIKLVKVGLVGNYQFDILFGKLTDIYGVWIGGNIVIDIANKHTMWVFNEGQFLSFSIKDVKAPGIVIVIPGHFIGIAQILNVLCTTAMMEMT